jgi:hypothetical protein
MILPVSRVCSSRSAAMALLVLVVVVAPAHAQAPAPDRALLEKRLAAAETSKDWAAALAAAVELDAIAEEEHVAALYRVARLHALLGHREEACESLERLSQAGLFDVGQVRKDEAFASLREDERFRRAVRAIWLRGYLRILERT